MTSTPRPGVAYYISAHGYGHGVRSADILRAVHRRAPDVPLHIVSELPEAFLRNRLGGLPAAYRPAALDVGMVQHDSIRVDVPRTLERVAELYRRRDERRAAEERFLEENRIALVVVDIPALPLEAAAARGRPRLAVANFAWDWIYSAFAESDPRWSPLIEQLQAGYRQADLLLRLPFSEELRVFPRRVDIPLLASPGRNRRDELARWTGADLRRPWVLLSFTSLDWDDAALDRVEGLTEYEFFTVLPLQWTRRNLHAVDRDQMPFSDVMASADIVVSKPGYGLLSDCIVNRKPLVYAERTDFIEYPILERAVKTYLRHAHIPAAQLYRGDLAEALAAVGRCPAPAHTMARGGDEIAAGHILSYYRAAV
jgi:hypothetical protein